MRVTWVDAGREPKCAPDPRYPTGIDVDASGGAKVSCISKLKYPAPRCGQHVIECEVCGQTAVVTTAGRVDDPRTVRIACKLVQPGH